MTRPPLDRRALGRELTRLANASAAELLRGGDSPATGAPAATPPARRIGLTGAPGAGKSTLAGHLALHRARQGAGQGAGQGARQGAGQGEEGRRVGVLAVDPSSPRSGGAILGDRIRMDELPGAGELYIRSIGSRSTHDGLSDNLPEMLDLMDAHGFDDVVLETVGVGQAEYAARVQVDTLVLVLLPDSGDAVQAMKAGIMEMADIFVVNKADLPGAQRMAADIRRIAALAHHEAGAWRAPVMLTSVRDSTSVAALSDAIDQHQQWLDQAGRRSAAALERARYCLRRVIERRVAETVRGLGARQLALPLARQVEAVLCDIRSLPDSPTPETRPC
ncbi:MAG: methylmalonyl Co-A mutase-associated GTPase MeaB [Burkholderiaceae bacterium]|nr:methylmalonyl Co-A mutase-associated GTPase MeaB [Burkholderiaceae bacterium]